jgi:activator of 2-hydroxyglutaryl-CoA dehydratase
MLVGGCDVGSATGKAVIMRNEEIVSYEIIPSTTKPEVTARTVRFGAANASLPRSMIFSVSAI